MGLTCSSWHCCRAAAPCLRSRQCSRTGTHLHHTCRSTPGIYPSKRTSRRQRRTEDQEPCSDSGKHSFAPFSVHAKILEMHILNVSRWQGHAEGQPCGTHSMASTWHSQPLSQQHWPGPSPILWPQAPAQPQHSSTYPACLAQAPLEQWVEGGRVPPPAGQTALCGTERAALTQGREHPGQGPLTPTTGCRGRSLTLEPCLDKACTQNCTQMGPALGTTSRCGCGSHGGSAQHVVPHSAPRPPLSTLSPSQHPVPLLHGAAEKGPTTLAGHPQHLTPLPRRARASVYLPASRCCL